MSNADKPDAGTDYDALSEWAETEMTLPPKSTTAKQGRDAASAGRALLDRAQSANT